MKTYLKNRLKEKYQPQWHFRTKVEARRELKRQKSVGNTSTYNWLMRKDILVGGKRVPAKEVMKRQRRRTSYRRTGFGGFNTFRLEL